MWNFLLLINKQDKKNRNKKIIICFRQGSMLSLKASFLARKKERKSEWKLIFVEILGI